MHVDQAQRRASTERAGSLPQRPLGRTGLGVPTVSLGTSRLGHPDISVSAAQETLDTALDEGIRYFDVAPHYGDAESKLRPFLRTRRQEVLVASKALANGPGRGATIAQVEESLRRTGAEYLDVCHIHSVGDRDFDDVFAADGALAGLEEARARNLVRYIGFTAHHFVPRVVRFTSSGVFDIIMLPLNVIDRHIYGFEASVLPIAAGQGTAVLAMKALGGAAPHKGAESTARLADHIDGAMRYALGLPDVASVVVGCSTAVQVRAVTAVARAYSPLDDRAQAALLSTGRALSADLGARWGPAE